MKKIITRAHGGGGARMQELIGEIFLTRFGNPYLNELNDFARVEHRGGPGLSLVLSPASFVVDPWEFPGGNIGDLAVCGTVNDLAMSGARPLYFYGQGYMGALEAYVAAGLAWGLGPSPGVVNLAPTLFALAWMVAAWWILRTLYGKPAGLCAAALFAQKPQG